MSSSSENESTNESIITSSIEQEDSENEDTKSVEFDLNESSTDSDEESDSGSEDNINNEEISKVKHKDDLIRERIEEKYNKRHGKQLFLRFASRLPEDEKEFQKQALELSPLIKEARKPRQKYARFCHIVFDSQSDRDTALKDIRAAIKTDKKLKGIVVSIPRTESEEFVKELINKKLQSLEAKKAKARLKRATKQAEKNKNFTPTIVVQNLPTKVSILEIRRLFSNAVDIQVKLLSNKQSSIATILMPSSKDARDVSKKEISLGGNRLKISFAFTKKKKKFNQKLATKQQNKRKNDETPKKILEQTS